MHSGNILSDISDHLPNFIILSSSVIKCDINNRPYIRLYTPLKVNVFSQILNSVDWPAVFDRSQDVNVCFDRFNSIVQNAIDHCFPLTHQSRLAFKDKKWITAGFKTSGKRKDVLYKKWLLSKKNG